jgi:uncharacterized protein with beta-barrel porin domain
MSISMQQKRGTASQWTSANPILLAGEIGFETDTNLIKIGDGTTAWNSLEYITSQNETQAFGNNYEGLVSIENLTTIDTVVASEWRTLKYVISMTKTSGGANKFAATELTVLIDGSNVTVSEYGAIDNDGDVGTVSVSQDGGNVKINVTPNLLVTPITVRYYRTGLKA